MSWATAVAFYGQMRQVLRTGLTLTEALPLAGGGHQPPYNRWATDWAAATANGGAWAEAMRASGEKPFPCALVAAGERSGRLDELCDQIVNFYQHCLTVRRMIVSRSIYPLVLIHAAMTIPTLPGVILGKHPVWMLVIGPVILWAMVAALVLVWVLGGRTSLRSRLALLPGLRAITTQLVVANGSLVLRAGLGAGMLMHDAMDLAAEACGNRIWAARLRARAQLLMDGGTDNLTTALGGTGWPGDLLQLISTGERSGELEDSLLRVSAIARDRFESRVTWTARVATGILLGLAMAYAAFTIISMFMEFYIQPIYDAANF